MGYSLLQISEILLKADKTMYRLGTVAYENMFSEDNEDVDFERDIIYIYKKAVEYADDFYVGTLKLDQVVERLANKLTIYNYGSLNPIYSDVSILNPVLPTGYVLNDLADVTITNLQDNQILKYNAALGQWVNTGSNAAIRSTQAFTATLNQTVFVTTSQFTAPLLDVYLNGVRLNSASYSTFGSHTITLYDGCLADDIIDVTIYDPQTDILDMIGYMKTSVYDKDEDGIVDDAEKISIIARNSTGATIHKGKIVYLQGSTGNRPNILLAQANTEASSSKTFGVVVADIANNADGQVAAIGTLHDLDTRSNAPNPFTADTLLDGDKVWLSATDAGYITRNPPVQPNHTVFIGFVVRTSPTNGRIVYEIQNGFELEELHNVLITAAANNDVLYYDSATSLWKNKPINVANIYNSDGTLTGNRVVDGGGFSLRLNPVLTFGERLTGITNKTFINGYTGGTSTRNSIFTINDSVTQNGGTFYEADSSNSRIYGTNTGISTGGIVSLSSFRHNIYLRGLTPSALIQGRNIIEQIREDASDVSTNGNNAFEGLGVYQTHWQTAGSSISTNRFWGFNHSAQIRSGTVIDNSSYRSTITIGQFTSNVTAVTNHYAFIAQATVGVSSGPTATITNYYGLFLNTPTVNATGTITNRWGVYAPDVSMRHYLNGNLLLGTTTDTGLAKIQVTGAIQQSSVLSSLLKTDGSGVLVAATLGTDYSVLPSQSGNTGKFLSTDGSALSWADVVSGVSSFNTRTGAVTLTSSDVTGALGYTPISTNIYTDNGTLTSNRTISTTSGYTLTINPATTFNGNVTASYINSGGGQLDLGNWGTTNLRLINGLMSYSKTGSDFNYLSKFSITSSNDGLNALGIYSTALGYTNAIGWTYSGQNSTLLTSSNIAAHDFTIQLRDGGKLHLFADGNTILTNGTPVNAGYKLDVNGTARVSAKLVIQGTRSFDNRLMVINDGNTSALSISEYNQDETTLVKHWVKSFGNGLAFLGTGGSATSMSFVVNANSITTNYDGITINDRAATLTNSSALNFFSEGRGFDARYTARISSSNNTTNPYDTAYPDLRFWTSNSSLVMTEAMRIDNNQSILVGTTSSISSSLLTLSSTTRGFLPPRMTTTQRDAIASPATGLVIYNTTTLAANVYNGTSWVGLGGDNIYTADGTLSSTTRVLSYGVSGNNENKLIFRNTGVTGGPNDDFIFEASIATAPRLKIWNPNYGGEISFSAGSIGFGGGRLYLSTSGHDITFTPGGVQAVRFFNGTGNVVIQNGGTFIDAGYKLDIVGGNARVNGIQVGIGNGTETTNTALGLSAMYLGAVTGIQNTAIGRFSLRNLSTGEYNTAIGADTMANLTNGARNTSLGVQAANISNGANNTVIGAFAGTAINGGNGNIFIGYTAGYNLNGISNILSINSKTLNAPDEPSGAIIYGVQASNLNNQILRLNARTGVGLSADPVASAQFQIDSTVRGFLPPRLTTTERNAITSPATGLQVYNSTTNTNDFYNGTAWVSNAAGNIYTADGTLTGNRTVTLGTNTLTFTGTSTSLSVADFVKTNDAFTYLRIINTNGGSQAEPGIRIQSSSGFLDIVNYPTAGGNSAASFFINNSANGIRLWNNTNSANAHISFATGTSNTERARITAAGRLLLGTTTESINILEVNGTAAFSQDIFVSGNVRIGRGPGSANSFNQVFGSGAGSSVTTGGWNTSVGYAALNKNVSGNFNTTLGSNALENSTGSHNTGLGFLTLGNITSGSNNVAIGSIAGEKISGGATNLTAADNSIFIGYSAKALADSQTNQIVIGHNETGLGSNTTIIGNSSTITTAIRGRLLLGTTTDSGSYQLDVNGTARFVQGITFASDTWNKSNVDNVNRIYFGPSNFTVFGTGSGGTGFEFRDSAGSTIANLTRGGSFILGNGTTDLSSAILQVTSTTKGFLPPRMTSTERTAISSPAVGLIVYQTNGTEGTYEYTSTGWRIINAAGGGSGTVTTVSVASANGFAGTVANATTTPAITISTTVTGLLKGNGTAISAATAGTDYLTPSDVAYSVANVSTTYSETATKGTKIIKADTTGGAFTINLPTAVSNTAIIIIKKVAGSGALTIDGNSTQTIDGGTTATINKVYESITLISDNSNWQIV